MTNANSELLYFRRVPTGYALPGVSCGNYVEEYIYEPSHASPFAVYAQDSGIERGLVLRVEADRIQLLYRLRPSGNMDGPLSSAEMGPPNHGLYLDSVIFALGPLGTGTRDELGRQLLDAWLVGFWPQYHELLSSSMAKSIRIAIEQDASDRNFGLAHVDGPSDRLAWAVSRLERDRMPRGQIPLRVVMAHLLWDLGQAHRAHDACNGELSLLRAAAGAIAGVPIVRILSSYFRYSILRNAQEKDDQLGESYARSIPNLPLDDYSVLKSYLDWALVCVAPTAHTVLYGPFSPFYAYREFLDEDVVICARSVVGILGHWLSRLLRKSCLHSSLQAGNLASELRRQAECQEQAFQLFSQLHEWSCNLYQDFGTARRIRDALVELRLLGVRTERELEKAVRTETGRGC